MRHIFRGPTAPIWAPERREPKKVGSGHMLYMVGWSKTAVKVLETCFTHVSLHIYMCREILAI
jgi:hypothetical protein